MPAQADSGIVRYFRSLSEGMLKDADGQAGSGRGWKQEPYCGEAK
jgi:hypothetical protein